MSWNFLISFAIGFGVYLLFLGVFALIKRHKIKKQLKEDSQKYSEEYKNEHKE